MIIKFILALIVTSIVPIPDPPQKLEWINDYGKALEICRTNQQPLLIVIDRDLPILEDCFFDGYVCCFVCEDTPYGKKIADAFGVEKFPFAAVIDRTGSVVLQKKNGDFNEKGWINFLDKSRNGIRSKVFDMGGEKFFRIPYYCPHCNRSIVQ